MDISDAYRRGWRRGSVGLVERCVGGDLNKRTRTNRCVYSIVYIAYIRAKCMFISGRNYYIFAAPICCLRCIFCVRESGPRSECVFVLLVCWHLAVDDTLNRVTFGYIWLVSRRPQARNMLKSFCCCC